MVNGEKISGCMSYLLIELMSAMPACASSATPPSPGPGDIIWLSHTISTVLALICGGQGSSGESAWPMS